jgi:polyhydroxyalkanoate synthesis regulator phasin
VPAQLVGNEVERRRGDLEDLIETAIETALSQLSLPSKREVERLSEQVDELSRRIDRLSGARPVRKPATRTRKRTAAARR